MSAPTHRRRALACLPFLALSVAPARLWAQLRQPEISDHGQVEFALSKPFLGDGLDELGFASMVLDTRLTVPVGSGTSVFIQSGLASATLGSERSTTLGNLSLGIAFGDPVGTFGSVSVTLPTAQEFGDDDFATGMAWLGDFDHPEAYVSEVYALDGTVAGTHSFTSGATLRWRVSGVGVGFTEEGADPELMARYGVGGSVPVGAARLGVDLSGYALISESGPSLSERTIHGLGVCLGMPGVAGRPEIFVRAPIDEALKDAVDATVGVRVTF